VETRLQNSQASLKEEVRAAETRLQNSQASLKEEVRAAESRVKEEMKAAEARQEKMIYRELNGIRDAIKGRGWFSG